MEITAKSPADHAVPQVAEQDTACAETQLDGSRTTAMLSAIRTALPRVKTVGPRLAFTRILDQLETARGMGLVGDLCRQEYRPNQIYSAFEDTLRGMTAADRDETTDHIVLAVLFALADDAAKVTEHLAAIPS